jgi:hypothetical protein
MPSDEASATLGAGYSGAKVDQASSLCHSAGFIYRATLDCWLNLEITEAVIDQI